MCTAISYSGQKHYFGRNLDFEHSFGEQAVVTPRHFSITLRHEGSIDSHFAIIGTAVVSGGYPLYFDATNEKGLSMAGLLFSGYAHYGEINPKKINIAPFELILYVLSKCKNTKEAKALLEKVNITNTHFSNKYLNTPLHWLISDKTESLVAESVKEGLKLYENPASVLTNSPDFPTQIFNLNNYMTLSPHPGKNHFSDKLSLTHYSRGMGLLGFPGDFSSASRFVRAAFFNMNCHSKENELNLFFHMLKNTSPLPGTLFTENGDEEVTVYSCCVDTQKCVYYYSLFEKEKIVCVDMYKEDVNSDELTIISLV